MGEIVDFPKDMTLRESLAWMLDVLEKDGEVDDIPTVCMFNIMLSRGEMIIMHVGSYNTPMQRIALCELAKQRQLENLGF